MLFPDDLLPGGPSGARERMAAGRPVYRPGRPRARQACATDIVHVERTADNESEGAALCSLNAIIILGRTGPPANGAWIAGSGNWRATSTRWSTGSSRSTAGTISGKIPTALVLDEPQPASSRRHQP